MKAFLSRIAETYISNEADNLKDYCFVFPNRRAGVFFHNYLVKAAHGAAFIMPRIATLNELAGDTTPLIEADRNEQLFLAYEKYCALQPEGDVDSEQIDFDKFLFWGSIILDDFNDVDSNLTDPAMLFVNVERWKEIKSNYLTPEQIDVIRQYWGDEPMADGVDQFWEHTALTDKSLHFRRLWEVLYALYVRFTDALRSQGLATRGMILREACARIDVAPDDAFPAKRYVFIGFDLLSGAERHIFKTLAKEGRADFYWDFNTLLNTDKDNAVVALFRASRKEFPSRYAIDEPAAVLPTVTITGVPGNSAMAAMAGEVLATWAKKKVIADVDNAVDTAVVIPDESLFIPMIHSVGENFTAINVTMGFPLKLTPVASLIRNLVSLHIRSRKRRNGAIEFYYEDVENILTSPLVNSMLPDDCESLLSDIRNNKLYNVSDKYIEEYHTPLSLFFDPVGDGLSDNADNACNYILRVLSALCDATSGKKALRLDAMFLESYRDAVVSLFNTLRRYEIDMAGATFFHLVERMVANKTASFEGKPLKGLQIMGVLETRALDFDNIIMTSMNDKVYPQKASRRSFIPNAIRAAYGLPTSEVQELRFGYYFFRLISRANNVTLLYDTREGISAGEISRMLTQLLYLYGGSGSIRHNEAVFNSMDLSCEDLYIEKSDFIRRRLSDYMMPHGTRSLSASALKTYLDCPMHFALRYLVRINPDDEIVDYMDASVYGKVVHRVIEDLYNALPQRDRDNVTERVLDHWIDNKDIVQRRVTIAINDLYRRTKIKDDTTDLFGESRVLGEVITGIVVEMLKHEKQFVPFSFVAAEKHLQSVWNVGDGLAVRFTQYIDRIDRVGDTLRIVDYKTGAEKLAFSSIEDMFTVGVKNEAKSIFQVLFYCHLYRLSENDNRPIQPYIYQLHDIFNKGLGPLKFSNETISDYHMIDAPFATAVNNMLSEIFNSDTPFVQAEDKSNCTFCKFKSICNIPD